MLARSPWQRGKQNGAALGGLLAYLVETVPSPTPMTVARLAIEILGAAPLELVHATIRVAREGARTQVVDVELLVNGVCFARCSALRIRELASPVFPPRPLSVPLPEALSANLELDQIVLGGTVETRSIRGGVDQHGPGAMWVKFDHQIVEGVPLSPLVRAAVLGDFGGGVSSVLDRRDWMFPNLDITIHFIRMPVGEWLMTESETLSAGNGLAQARATLADREGIFGYAFQSLFIQTRPRKNTIQGDGLAIFDREAPELPIE